MFLLKKINISGIKNQKTEICDERRIKIPKNHIEFIQCSRMSQNDLILGT